MIWLGHLRVKLRVGSAKLCQYCKIGTTACKALFKCNNEGLTGSDITAASIGANATGSLLKALEGTRSYPGESDLYLLSQAVKAVVAGEGIGRVGTTKSNDIACDICNAVGTFACPVACLAYPPVCPFCGGGAAACKAVFKCNSMI